MFNTCKQYLTYGVALFMDHTGQILHDLTDVQHVSLWTNDTNVTPLFESEI